MGNLVYFREKLSTIILRLTAHPGDAVTRLKSEGIKILILSGSCIPDKDLAKDFKKIQETLR